MYAWGDERQVEMDDNGKIIVREEEDEPKREKRAAPSESAEEEEKETKGRERRIRRIKREDNGEQDGSRFRSDKAKGDMKKGNVQPYAYIRLDSRMLSKKKQNQSLGKFNNLIGAAKKGAREGSGKRRKQN